MGGRYWRDLWGDILRYIELFYNRLDCCIPTLEECALWLICFGCIDALVFSTMELIGKTGYGWVVIGKTRYWWVVIGKTRYWWVVIGKTGYGWVAKPGMSRQPSAKPGASQWRWPASRKCQTIGTGPLSKQ